VGDADSPVMWSHPNLSEPATKGQNNAINMGDLERSKITWRLKFIYLKHGACPLEHAFIMPHKQGNSQ
jgi:hypothetical protein